MSRLTEALNRDDCIGVLDTQAPAQRLAADADPVTMAPMGQGYGLGVVGDLATCSAIITAAAVAG